MTAPTSNQKEKPVTGDDFDSKIFFYDTLILN